MTGTGTLWCQVMLRSAPDMLLWECVDDGWYNQPHLSESAWTLGLGESIHLLHIDRYIDVCLIDKQHLLQSTG